MAKLRSLSAIAVLSLLFTAIVSIQSVKACIVDPQIRVFYVMIDGNSYEVSTFSNSTISDFSFNQPERTISFNVSGYSDTTGFCNVTFPVQLLGGPYLGLIDGSQQAGTVTSNATHTSVYFTYQQSNHNLNIVGATVAPEFPTMVASMLVLSAMTLMLLFTKRRLVQET